MTGFPFEPRSGREGWSFHSSILIGDVRRGFLGYQPEPQLEPATSRPQLFPQPFEPATGHARIVHGVPGVAMPEIVLHGAQVGAPVGKIVAARVPQHVRMDPLQADTLAGDPHQVLHGRSRQRLATLGQEQPWKLIGAGGQIPFDGAQLVAGRWAATLGELWTGIEEADPAQFFGKALKRMRKLGLTESERGDIVELPRSARAGRTTCLPAVGASKCGVLERRSVLSSRRRRPRGSISEPPLTFPRSTASVCASASRTGSPWLAWLRTLEGLRAPDRCGDCTGRGDCADCLRTERKWRRRAQWVIAGAGVY